MRIQSWVGLAALAVFSCGGSSGSKGAASATTTTTAPSNVSLTPAITGSDALDVTGPAFAKYDPVNKMLVVLLFDAATDPTPSCDLLDPTKAASLKKGTVVTFQIGNLPDAKVGSYPLGGVSYAKGDQAKGDMSMGGGAAPEGTKIQISQIDTSSLTADVTDPKTGKSFASIHATVCKAGSMSPAGADTQGASATVTGETGAPPETNVFDMQMADGKTQKTGGENGLVMLDPKQKVLFLYVWEFGFMPQPTCDQFAMVAKNSQAGKFSVLAVPNIAARKPGSYKVGDGQFFDLDQNPISYGEGKFTDSTITITDFNDGIFNATIASSPTAKDKVTGTMNAAVCPDGPVVFPTQEKAKAKGKKGKGGAKKK